MAKSFKSVGSWAFLAGVIVALVFAILSELSTTPLNNWWMIALVVIGLIVGFFNVAGREIMPFLMSGAVLIIASAFGGSLFQAIPVLPTVFNALLAIFVPATIIVAVKNVFVLAKN